MRFDTNALALRGQEVRLGEAVVGAVSDNGTFVYAGTPVHLDGDAAPATVRALRVDRDGTRGAVSLPSDGCGSPSLSPDGRRLALVCPGGGQRRDIAIGDLRRDLLTRWPSEGRDRSPVWTPDGTAIAYSSERDGVWRLQLRRVHGTQPAETLWESDQPLYPNSWHPDGRVLAVQRILPETGEDIWLLDVNGDRRPVAWLASPANESGARFSRDGKWIAYHSNESGSWHVYAAEYPGPGTKTQLSIESGGWPLWSRSGRELFYYANRPTGVLMVVDAGPAALLDPSRPRPLFDERLSIIRTRQGSAFDVGPEDDWFVVSGLEQRRVHTEIHVVFNWFDELRRRVPIER
jgi:Tol biopolymer transport system component